jgi:hypothetical protein
MGISNRKLADRPRRIAVPEQFIGFRGNKAALPSKPCEVCGLPMSWRRSWAKNWGEVRYCSETCRRKKAVYG